MSTKQPNEEVDLKVMTSHEVADNIRAWVKGLEPWQWENLTHMMIDPTGALIDAATLGVDVCGR